MKNILFFLILTGIVFLQTSILKDIEIFGVVPNLSLVFFLMIIFWIQDFKMVFISALFFGLFLDFFSGFSFGVFTLTFIFLAFFLNLLLAVFVSRDNILVLFFMIFIGTFAYYLLILTLTNIFNFFNPNYFSLALDINFVKTAFIEFLYNLIILFLLLPLKRFL